MYMVESDKDSMSQLSSHGNLVPEARKNNYCIRAIIFLKMIQYWVILVKNITNSIEVNFSHNFLHKN